MKRRKVLSLMLSAIMVASVAAGCGNKAESTPSGGGDAAETATETTTDSNSGSDEAAATTESGEVTDFTMFITMPGSEINDDNEIAQMIADKYGVRVKETWLTGQTASEATGTLIAGGEYPDFIDSDEMNLLIDADALVPLDDYIDKYPEFKETWFT